MLCQKTRRETDRNRDRDVLKKEKGVLTEEKVHWEVRILSTTLGQNLNLITSCILGQME